MPIQIEHKKWILYRHTNNLDIIQAVAVNLHSYSNSNISTEEKKKLTARLRDLDYYQERNPELPLDAINHKINTLAYFMFGHKARIDRKARFLFSPLGKLMLENFDDEEKSARIFLTQLFAIQFPHPHGGTPNDFQLYPYRLILKLLQDNRLDCRLYSLEITTILVFVEEINAQSYEELVSEILSFRALSSSEKIRILNSKHHAHVNAYYEWDYYQSKLFVSAGVLEKSEGPEICRMNHGSSTTRVLKNSFVKLNPDIDSYCKVLLAKYSPFKKPLKLNDPTRLEADVVKEIYSFIPDELFDEIGAQKSEGLSKVLNLMRAIEYHSENPEEESPYKFEEFLTDAFNYFLDVEAVWRGGAGRTDVECVYLIDSSKFCIDGKTTSKKLSALNAGRLRLHRNNIGAKYTIVVTPRFTPSVITDIEEEDIVIIRSSTFTEYLYQLATDKNQVTSYTPIHSIIQSNKGKDVSPMISELTFRTFAS
jgi:type II restriction enzyme